MNFSKKVTKDPGVKKMCSLGPNRETERKEISLELEYLSEYFTTSGSVYIVIAWLVRVHTTSLFNILDRNCTF
jgi:hypothetical protein